MRLCVRSLAGASAVLWGGMFLIVAIAHQATGTYGAHILDLGASVYPGYEAGGGLGSVVVVTLYALLDGAVFGALFAWVYNLFAGSSAAG